MRLLSIQILHKKHCLSIWKNLLTLLGFYEIVFLAFGCSSKIFQLLTTFYIEVDHKCIFPNEPRRRKSEIWNEVSLLFFHRLTNRPEFEQWSDCFSLHNVLENLYHVKHQHQPHKNQERFDLFDWRNRTESVFITRTLNILTHLKCFVWILER